jgi:hypothetical protein
MREIPLSQGKVALVDDVDVALVADFQWYAVRTGKDKKHTYARGRRIGGDGRLLYMHRLILGAGKGQDVDHKNGQTLDNQRSNLRTATRQQNQGNRFRSSSNTGFKGVFHYPKCTRNPYLANCGGQHLGCFSTATKAARFYDMAARDRYGEFACVNFPRPGERSALTGEIEPPAVVAGAA